MKTPLTYKEYKAILQADLAELNELITNPTYYDQYAKKYMDQRYVRDDQILPNVTEDLENSTTIDGKRDIADWVTLNAFLGALRKYKKELKDSRLTSR